MPWFTFGVVCILGLVVGSFLNVVIYRVPVMLFKEWKEACDDILQNTPKDLPTGRFNLAIPNSCCPHCKAKIKPSQNIPVVSFLILKGSCGSCGKPIAARYPLVELFTGIASIAILWIFGPTLQGALALILIWVLIALTMIDIDHQLLPDNITLPLMWLGLSCNLFNVYTDINSAVIGAIAGYLSLWSVYWIFKLVTKKEGMGYGDFKLLAALGAWMGWQYLPVIIILSSFVGAAFGIVGMLFSGKDKEWRIPFGPYLAIAGVIALFWGDAIIAQYLSFSGLTPQP
ncbi:MAG: A24 family peptidase [Marinagarivorans sp.]|nr:A24 family peptidase [Marinagarivorans sp.]